MAWFSWGLVLLWYASYGVHENRPRWQAPWYTTKKSCRLAMICWPRYACIGQLVKTGTPEERKDLLDWLFLRYFYFDRIECVGFSH